MTHPPYIERGTLPGDNDKINRVRLWVAMGVFHPQSEVAALVRRVDALERLNTELGQAYLEEMNKNAQKDLKI